MPTSTRPAAIVFVVPGQDLTAPASRGAGTAAATPGAGPRLKASVRVGARRDGGQAVRVSAVPGEDVVVLRLAGGPVLTLHPETARDLLLGQGGAKRGPSRSAAAAAADITEVPVPAQLRWRGLEQAAPTRGGGFLGDVLLQAFEVITGFAKDKAVNFVTSQAVQRVDGQVDAGVYALQPESLAALKGSGFKLAQVPPAPQPATQPLLVLLHGTFVETVSTFGKLWVLHPQQVRQLFTCYGSRVYALDHPTLGASPMANALTLVQALPAGARLHLVTHSRGGLVAEVLARVCGQPTLGAADLAFFAGDAYAAQRRELQALAAAVKAKDIRVLRVVRVACPARGTLLASQRLDAYLSVLKWTLEVSGVPIVPQLVDFLNEVARRRANPAELPGLAAMIPDTPLVNWLNTSLEPIPGDLRVVAGDMQGDSVGSWLKTLLADAYYWTDNDIVVQTRSMYGGSARTGGATFLLDQGGKVNHFNYFSNERTVQAVVSGLTQDQPAGFATIGPLSWAGKDSGGTRAALRGADGGRDGTPVSDKPAVFVLPGILGSNLKVNDKRIWLSLRLIGGLSRLGYQAGGADHVLPDGPIGLSYDDLMDHLSVTHEVIAFSYDWRRPIEEEARRLADAVEAALDGRNASGQPVRLLAHSMGGLVARTMQLERPKTWARMMERTGGRLVMLGTPNGGSWAPMQVLSGDDTFGNALAAFGSPLHNKDARQLMAEMPGFLQLQAALTDPSRGLDKESTWRELAEDDLKKVQENNWWHTSNGEQPDAAYTWGVPTQAVLDQSRTLRLRLDAQRDGVMKTFADKMLLVVGHARFTPDGYATGDDGFVYLEATDGGDGRVALDSALLPGVRTWTLDCEHGGLPDKASAFDAFTDLLMLGDTTRLSVLPGGATRGSGTARAPVAHVRSRPSRGRPSALPAQSERSVFLGARGVAVESPDTLVPSALKVTVLNGNLSFVRDPLLVGHTRSLKLTGTEAVINRLIGGGMQASLEAGLYPDAPGSHQVFLNASQDPNNPWAAPRPHAVVVAGLGEEGTLTEQALTLSVRQAVIAWAQRVAETAGGAPVDIRLCTTLMGSGGVGMNASNAARSIAQGVRDANQRLAGAARVDDNADAGKPRMAPGWPVVSQLTLVELYLERASDAWHGLQVLAASAPGAFDITPTIASGVGPLRRQIDSGYRGADYDFITALSPVGDTIAFTLDTKRARTEVRAQSTQGKLLRDLVAKASTDANSDPRLGRTLFQLLVPPEVEPFLSGTNRMLLELDDRTAPIPWELLDTQRDDQARNDERPWAIRTQLLRKLRQENYRQQVQDASPDDAVLIVGEPLADRTMYPALPGARAEALAVRDALLGAGGLSAERVNALVADDTATSVINALFERRYRIVHIAGHGEPVTRDDKGKVEHLGGVVLSDGTFLGPDEIKSMRTVPELVFVNCCHLAGRDTSSVLKPRDPFNRAEFAWGVADSLIKIGVRCVIAAGWAVDDGPAKVFATAFYREILAGRAFIHAVAAGREAAWNDNRGSNTWAAYQCYGDPNWTYRRGVGDAQAPAPSPRDEFDGVASSLGLALALEELTVKSQWMGAPADSQLEKIRHLQARFAPLWGGMGAVAEAFAGAYAAANDIDSAITWYQNALSCNDASASMKAHEQLGNLQARRAWSRVDATAPDANDFGDIAGQARKDIGAALRNLQVLADLQPTLERHSLCGSAYKRLAMLESKAGDKAAESAALATAAMAYQQAETIALAQQDPNRFYPALNRMALALMAALTAHSPPLKTKARADGSTSNKATAWPLAWPGFNAEATAAVHASLLARTDTDPDFWSYAGLIDLAMYQAVAKGKLAAVSDQLLANYDELHGRVSNPKMWGSVADQAQWLLSAYVAVAPTAEAAAAHRLREALLLRAGITSKPATSAPGAAGEA